MKNLIIIGAGGCGREILQWAVDINEKHTVITGNVQWNIKGFIDDDMGALENKKCEYRVISKLSEYQIEENDLFVCAIGNGIARKKIIEQLKRRGANFTNLIHPTANIANTAYLGESMIIYPYAIISDNAVLKDGCMINMYSSIAHDSILGEYCTISAHCDVTGMCTLGDNVFMGTTSNLVPNTKVGNNVYICAGSTVMTKLRDNVRVLGIPAKKINF